MELHEGGLEYRGDYTMKMYKRTINSEYRFKRNIFVATLSFLWVLIIVALVNMLVV